MSTDQKQQQRPVAIVTGRRQAYQGIAFTPSQAARLAAVFASGVCDWTKPGVGQTDAVPTTFAEGPGGKPLPSPPVAVH